MTIMDTIPENPPKTPNKVMSDSPQRPMSDTELAAQYKHDMTLALQAVTLIMDRARAQGLIIGFVNIGMTQSGKYEAGGITVARYF